jgi:hypothetical protein
MLTDAYSASRAAKRFFASSTSAPKRKAKTDSLARLMTRLMAVPMVKDLTPFAISGMVSSNPAAHNFQNKAYSTAKKLWQILNGQEAVS